LGSEVTVHLALESKMESVEIGEEAARRFAREAGFEEAEETYIGLAVREVLINAIRHGNRFDAKKKAAVRLARDPENLVVEVADEGQGFRIEDVPDPLAPRYRQRRTGRGLKIAIGVMDEFHVEKNEPHGTLVRMRKRMGRG
jgi:serine/threonine-protein kinase RsbW